MQRDRKILSIDGSGFRALTQLHLLHLTMEEVNVGATGNSVKRPYQIFDLICGTAAGGLIAILLGRLGMNCKDAIDTYLQLEGTLFARPNAPIGEPWPLSDLLTTTFDTRPFQAKLKNVVKECLGSLTAPDTDPRFLMSAKDKFTDTCRTFVTVLETQNAFGDDDATRIRSYTAPDKIPSPVNWTIWDAAMGTAACPQLFSAVEISSIFYQAASASGFANPSMIAYLEALKLFGTPSNPPSLTFLSLGMGLRSRHDYSVPSDAVISKHIENLPNTERIREFIRQTQLVAVATRVKDLRVANLMGRTTTLHRYFRLDPNRGNKSLVLVDFAQGSDIEQMVHEFWGDVSNEAWLQTLVTRLKGTWAWQWAELIDHVNDPDVAPTESLSVNSPDALSAMDQCHRWEEKNNNVITCFSTPAENGSIEITTGPVQPIRQSGSTLFIRVLLDDAWLFFPRRTWPPSKRISNRLFNDSAPRSPVDLIRRATERGTIKAFRSDEWSTDVQFESGDLIRNSTFRDSYQGIWVRKT